MFIEKNKYLIMILIIASLSALLGGIAGGLFVSFWDRATNVTGGIEAGLDANDLVQVTEDSHALQVSYSDVETSISEVVQELSPAVVTVTGSVTVRSGMFGGSSTAEVSGSGVYITGDGYLITNQHVVEDASDFYVILADGQKLEASLVGADIFSDLAVLKTVEAAPAVAVLGNSDMLDPGETVIAIGSPLGEFSNSVTVGVVSGTGRSLDSGLDYSIEDLIQTDAAINQGNSGGPLVNLAGEVIGINALVVRGSRTGTVAEGLGFAIPSNTAQAVASQIIETGRFLRPYLGVQWRTITPNLAMRYRLPVEWGTYVTGVYEGSPAETAGIMANDIITQIAGVKLDEEHSFINVLYDSQPGDTVEVGLIRDEQEIFVEVVLGGS